jgi:hypothetical protein
LETEVRQFVLLSASNLGEALALCAGGDPVTVDVGQANDRWFINAASFGFDATSRTPSRLNCLGSSKRLGLHRRPIWPSVTDRSGF